MENDGKVMENNVDNVNYILEQIFHQVISSKNCSENT